MAVFGADEAREADPENAVRAALAVIEAARDLPADAANAALVAEADRLPHAEAKRLFLHDVPHHRTIVEAWERDPRHLA